MIIRAAQAKGKVTLKCRKTLNSHLNNVWETIPFGKSGVVLADCLNHSLMWQKNLHISSYTHLPEEKTYLVCLLLESYFAVIRIQSSFPTVNWLSFWYFLQQRNLINVIVWLFWHLLKWLCCLVLMESWGAWTEVKLIHLFPGAWDNPKLQKNKNGKWWK